jgi:murein DD-endopeptidase MepM/ murein hydrolase activator NlpD
MKAFLKAPLKFSHITSHYSMKRFHPVLHTFKAHLGTDYAAPTGTPIMTVGDGTILDARYTANNGNYVKVKHNAHITNQYLHMCRIATGIRPGVHVSQGQIIGYVGSTGLATGPHVCFRYWLDGKQVDWLKQKTVPSDPINKSDRPQFEQVVQQFNKQLLNLKPTVAMNGN